MFEHEITYNVGMKDDTTFNINLENTELKQMKREVVQILQVLFKLFVKSHTSKSFVEM